MENGAAEGSASVDAVRRAALKFHEKMRLFSVAASALRDRFLYLVPSVVTGVI